MEGPAGEIVPATEPARPPELEAAELRDRLAELELEHATLESELAAFHADYMRQVGTVMARVHELQARLLRLAAERSGGAVDARAADAAEAQARRTTADLEAIPEPPGPPPTDDVKKLFREAAKRMHPDVAPYQAARAHAEAFMKRLTQAYRAGDAEAIVDLLRQWEASPLAAATGEPAGPDADRRRSARELAALRAAVAAAEQRLAEIRGSQLADLLEQVMAATARGEDLLARMRTDAEVALRAAQARLGAEGA